MAIRGWTSRESDAFAAILNERGRMGNSFKNRTGILPIGTRVVPTYDRITPRIGTVVEYSKNGERMVVKWDDDNTPGPSGYFSVPEIRKAD